MNLEVDPQELHVTVCNNNYPIIRGEKGRKMNYRTLSKHILSLLGLYEPLKDTLNVMEGFDFFHMIGIQKKLDGRRNNGKRRRSDETMVPTNEVVNPVYAMMMMMMMMEILMIWNIFNVNQHNEI